MPQNAKKAGASTFFRTLKGQVIADAKYPGMYRVRWAAGVLSDMVNLSRAKDALRP